MTKIRSKGLHPEKLPFLPPVAAGMARLLFSSCRLTILGKEHEAAAKSERGSILITTWHFAYPAVIHYFRDGNKMTMVSRSRDGEWAARILSHLGYLSVRGSPGKGGDVALRQLIGQIKATGGGFVADGSQGPPRIAQKGILLLARYTQAPLFPVSMAASPCWRLRSWDRTVIPKPFSRIVLAFGPPMRVKRDATAAELDAMRQALEDSLNRLTLEARNALGIGAS